MIEATEKIVTNVLQKITSYGFLQRMYFYGSAATKEIWTALPTPENIPVFIGSLVKSSLGPTLAFYGEDGHLGKRRLLEEKKKRQKVQGKLRPLRLCSRWK